MKRHFLGFCLAAVLLIGVFCPLARAETPDFPAQALVLMEASTGQVLYEKSAHVQRPCASITKVMTLLLVFEAVSYTHLDVYKRQLSFSAAQTASRSSFVISTVQEPSSFVVTFVSPRRCAAAVMSSPVRHRVSLEICTV